MRKHFCLLRQPPLDVPLYACRGGFLVCVCFSSSVRLSINPRTAKMQKSKPAKTKNRISKRISHSRKKRLCESIFAYCVNRSSTYLCTPVGAVSLSACVCQRLQRVEKYFFNTLKATIFYHRGFSYIHLPDLFNQ